MSLRVRVALVVAVITMVVLGALLTFNRFVLSAGFENAERQEVDRDVRRVVHAVDIERERLGVLVADWASWDDSYNYMETRNPEFVRSNMPPDILQMMQLGAMVLYDTDGRVVLSRTADSEGEEAALPEFAVGAPLVQDLRRRVSTDGTVSGVVRLSGGTMALYGRPVMRSDGSGPVRGLFVFARWMNDHTVQALSSSLATPLEFIAPSDAAPEVTEHIIDGNAATLVRPEDGNLVGYGLVRDVEGAPAIVVRTEQPRGMRALAMRATWTLVAGILATGVLLMGTVLAGVEWALIRPTRRLRAELGEVRSGTEVAQVTATAGGGEISDVAREVNEMLARLAAAAREEQRLTSAVHEQEALATLALESMTEGLIAFDEAGRCTVCNRSAARLLGTTVGEVHGRNLETLLPDLHAAVEGVEGRGPHLIEVAGRTLAVSRSVDSGEHPLLAIVLRDVTDVLSVERLKRDVISTVSHELRTPLTSILATVELLGASDISGFSSVQQNLVALLSRNVSRLGVIVNDLLTMSALEVASVQLNRDEFDLGALCTRVAEDVRPAAEAGGIVIRVETTGRPVTWGDEGRLRQVIENLVQNAVKFSPSDSEVRVAVASTSDGARVTVSDQGPGIPPDDLERVFEKFYRANNAARITQGTGLGLPIARTITELHGGRLWLQSDGKQGTTAILFIPAQAVEARA